ncbi:PREDICTED: uncharacterized protein LOC101304350 [Fragaria vesca subsp. vesca]|uniref:uncharacterized protein LOC101304350 n=1 Tax=Fragaria vesca subsp. vesca TaxID=101020 RepID=UPI0002C356A6|nr:PREDICTED: uncharacterized protein LOC101304350 [Fragaria vesca subsp. vesca]XP_011459055.1 PREDICTED: uncharacterized protein LOC101304350 [Fragaria vesca subsp. vesca]
MDSSPGSGDDGGGRAILSERLRAKMQESRRSLISRRGSSSSSSSSSGDATIPSGGQNRRRRVPPGGNASVSSDSGGGASSSSPEIGASSGSPEIGASSTEVLPLQTVGASIAVAKQTVPGLLTEATAASDVPEAVAAVPAVPEAAVAVVDTAAIRQITNARVSALHNTRLELNLCLSRGEFYLRLIKEKNLLISVLDISDMRTIIFYYRHLIQEERVQRWETRRVAHFLQERMNHYNHTVGQELECARNRVRFERFCRCAACPAIYAPFFDMALFATAMGWVILEERDARIDLNSVLALTKARLLWWKRNPEGMP